MKHANDITIRVQSYHNGLWYDHAVEDVDVTTVINAVERHYCIGPMLFTIYQLLMAGF